MFAEIYFEKKKVDVFDISNLDSVFQILYGYFEQDSMHFMMKRYDNSVTLKDSSTFLKIHKKDIRRRIATVVSEDKSKVLMYTVDPEDRFIFVLYDNNSNRVLWSQKVFIKSMDIHRNLVEIKLINNGEFLIILKDDAHTSEGDRLHIVQFNTASENYKSFYINFKDFYRRSYISSIDNMNNRLIICGIYAPKEGKDAKGYYYLNTPLDRLSADPAIHFLDFDSTLEEELLHGKKKRSKIVEDLKITDLIHRRGGGFLIISEVTKEFSRRNPYNNTYSRSSYSGYTRRGWIDYYNDDIVITAIDVDHNEAWTEVLYKKQFSQDDEAVFSSFFLMKTPSRLRIIYNDEIKKSNTVSEYILDPVGNIARNSLLSTEYQDMKLRFQDALQIGSNSILVPSEKGYSLNLVKITY